VKAARFHARGDIRIDDVVEPAIRPGAVKIKVAWCGICGTDLHEYTNGPIFCPSPDTPHPLTGETPPVVLGHEFAGTVVELGEGVSRIALGARVAVEPRITCGSCAACRSGRHNTCADAATIGLAGAGGGLAEYIVVDEALVFDIGDLPLETGALIEPLAVAVHAVRQSGALAGEFAVVFGAGPIGLLVSAVLKAQHGVRVVLVEPNEHRRAQGEKLGADALIDPLIQDVETIVRELTDGVGADRAFECAGVDASLAGCLAAVRTGGTVVNVALRSTPARVDLLPLSLKEISLVGTICYANDYPAVIELLQSGRLNVDSIITKRIELHDLVVQGFQTLLGDDGSQAKILVGTDALSSTGY
jgi:(R,R)-butanediol dehydrogenase/meso-butanediol dehydrogenase/diacetyl reductase